MEDQVINKDFVDPQLEVESDSSLLIVFLVVGVVLSVVAYLFLFQKKAKKNRDSILICGPNDTGKTTFFYKVREIIIKIAYYRKSFT